MPLYKRKFPCSVCGKPVYWDSDRQLLSCGCGTTKATFVNLEHFEKLPKFDRKFWSSEVFPIDCAKFLSNEILLDGRQILFISDRNSIVAGNEDPKLVARWIHYPKDDKIQLCFAISGSFHTEKICYNQKDPNQWNERIWIFLPREIIPKLIEFMQKDPLKLENWM